MKKLLIILGLLLISLNAYSEGLKLPFNSEAWTALTMPKLPIFPDKVDEFILNHSVMLLEQSNDPFCSGVIARDPDGILGVFTAGHCCQPYSIYGQQGRVMDINNNVYLTEIPSMEEGDYSQVNDICRMRLVDTPRRHIHAPTIAPVGQDRFLKLISPSPYYDKGQRFQSVFITGISMENSNDRIVANRFFPGMSGSPIVNIRGELVAIVVVIYPFTKEDASIISILDNT